MRRITDTFVSCEAMEIGTQKKSKTFTKESASLDIGILILKMKTWKIYNYFVNFKFPKRNHPFLNMATGGHCSDYKIVELQTQ